MSIPRSPEARRYYRVALQRLEDGQVLATTRPAASIYLAGYAVECILKALILTYVPQQQHRSYVREHFHGAAAHNLEWLRAELRRVNAPQFPREVRNNLAFVSTWSTDLRYTPGVGNPNDAQRFLDEVKSVVEFTTARLR